MKMIELITLLATGKEIDVEFAKRISDAETYAEPGMRATVVSITPDVDNVLKLKVNYQKFETFNEAFESHNYWGVVSKGQDPSAAEYTARETGWYKVEEQIYLMADDEVEDFMTIISFESFDLYDEWRSSNTDQTYVSWLESQVRELKQGSNAATILSSSIPNGVLNEHSVI